MSRFMLSFLIMCFLCGIGALQWYGMSNYPRVTFGIIVLAFIGFMWAGIYRALRGWQP